MSAIGPAIVISCILELNHDGYAKHKGLTSSTLLAVSIDNIIAITVSTILVKKLIPIETSSTIIIFTGIPKEYIIFLNPIFMLIFGIFPSILIGLALGKLT